MLSRGLNSQGLLADHSLKQYSIFHDAPLKEIRNIQGELLKKQVQFAAEKSPFYKEFFRAYGTDLDAINSYSDLQYLPMTSKHDIISQGYNFIASPDKELAEGIMLRSGPGNASFVQMHSREDVLRKTYNMETTLKTSCVSESDTVLICSELGDCQPTGISYFLGCMKLNSNVLRGGGGDFAGIWQIIKAANPTVLVGRPSFLSGLGHYAVERGITPGNRDIEKVIALDESMKDRQLRPLTAAENLEDLWEASVFQTFESREAQVTFSECRFRQGVHTIPELAVIEIVDEDGEPLPDGQPGEVVITPLGVTGMPLIRFQTGEISFIISEEKCMCGRSTPRMGPLLGSGKHMLKIEGCIIFPNMILSSLEGRDYFYGGYIEARKSFDGSDIVTLYVALREKMPVQKITEDIKSKLKVAPNIVTVEPEEVDKRLYGKSSREKKTAFFDFR
jgi:phenylacetate-CoA ligase